MANIRTRLNDLKDEVAKIGEVLNGVKESRETMVQEFKKGSVKLEISLEVLVENLCKNSTGIPTVNDECEINVNVIKKEARIAQESHRQLDKNEAYNTLVDPNQRTRQELADFGKIATHMYNSGLLSDIGAAFKDKFKFLHEEYFKVLQSTVLTPLHEALIKRNIQVVEMAELRIFKPLEIYINTFRKKNGKKGMYSNYLHRIEKQNFLGKIANLSEKILVL